MNLKQAKKELQQARDDAMWLWLTAKRDIMAEVMVDESNPEWAREEARQSYDIIGVKLEKLGRKMDDAADAAFREREVNKEVAKEIADKLVDLLNKYDGTFVGDASDTPDTKPKTKYYCWDPIRMINVEEEE